MKTPLRNLFSVTFNKWQIKLLLGAVGFVIIFAVIAYTQTLVEQLIERERKSIDLYTDIFRQNAEGLSQTEVNNELLDLYLQLMQKLSSTINFPMISTDENDQPIYPFELWTLNADIDTTKSIQAQREYLQEYINEMRADYDPIIVRYGPEGEQVTKFYYTNSNLVKNLRYFPYIASGIMLAFVFIGYIAFSNIRKSEESKVWVGMAKEAAHQLGTPLSSLLAWIEILKINRNEPEKVEETAGEMENDINRLNKIAVRFSKIGSRPEMTEKNISEVIERVCNYFEKRLPHLGRKLEIIRECDDTLTASISADLFEWVIENLLKNAAEAIEAEKGVVKINLHRAGHKAVITVRDNGKGMSAKQRRQVFFPGYTTKKRG